MGFFKREDLFECRKCGGQYRAVAFRLDGPSATHDADRRRPRCRLCEISARTEAKRHNRYREKARGARERHAKKYGLSVEDFAERFGWDLDRMASDIERAMQHDCPYCEESLAEEIGLADLTIDIVDREKPPHYATNAKWCCRTCNQVKGTTPSEEWGDFLQYRKAWKKRQRKLQKNPLAFVPLFAWANDDGRS